MNSNNPNLNGNRLPYFVEVTLKSVVVDVPSKNSVTENLSVVLHQSSNQVPAA